MWGGSEYEVLADPDRAAAVPLRDIGTGRYYVVFVHSLSPVPPEVVTLTLSYRGHEVSEEMSVDLWRVWVSAGERGNTGVLARAARALAEKVDGEAHDV